MPPTTRDRNTLARRSVLSVVDEADPQTEIAISQLTEAVAVAHIAKNVRTFLD